MRISAKKLRCNRPDAPEIRLSSRSQVQHHLDSQPLTNADCRLRRLSGRPPSLKNDVGNDPRARRLKSIGILLSGEL